MQTILTIPISFIHFDVFSDIISKFPPVSESKLFVPPLRPRLMKASRSNINSLTIHLTF